VYAVYLFGAVLAVLLLAVVAGVLRDRETPTSGRLRAEPEERQREALDALRELEFDHLTGTVSDDEYDVQYDRYAREALAARDEIAADAGFGPDRDRDSSCSACAAPVRSGAHYCSRCGAPIDARIPGSRGDEDDT